MFRIIYAGFCFTLVISHSGCKESNIDMQDLGNEGKISRSDSVFFFSSQLLLNEDLDCEAVCTLAYQMVRLGAYSELKSSIVYTKNGSVTESLRAMIMEFCDFNKDYVEGCAELPYEESCSGSILFHIDQDICHSRWSLNRSIACWDSMISSRSDSAELYIGRGSIFERLGRYDWADWDFVRAIELRGYQKALCMRILSNRILTNNYNTAFLWLDHLKQVPHFENWTRFFKYIEELKRAERLIDSDKSNYVGYILKARVYTEFELYSEALDILSLSLEVVKEKEKVQAAIKIVMDIIKVRGHTSYEYVDCCG